MMLYLFSIVREIYVMYEKLILTVMFLEMMLLVRLIQTVRETHLKSIDSSVPLKINKAEGGSRRKRTCRIAVLLGSGGHTAEMIRLLDQLPFDRYTPRIYLICSNDRLSKQKAIQLESSKGKGQFSFAEIPRARNFGQSFLTTPLTTLYSLSFCLYLISIKPLTLGLKNLKKKVKTETTANISADRRGNDDDDEESCGRFCEVLVLNGPGTCVPIAISAFLPRLISFKFSPKIIYVESFTRVKNLSLSGKMLVTMTDEFLVQWKNICVDPSNINVTSQSTTRKKLGMLNGNGDDRAREEVTSKGMLKSSVDVLKKKDGFKRLKESMFLMLVRCGLVSDLKFDGLLV